MKKKVFQLKEIIARETCGRKVLFDKEIKLKKKDTIYTRLREILISMDKNYSLEVSGMLTKEKEEKAQIYKFQLDRCLDYLLANTTSVKARDIKLTASLNGIDIGVPVDLIIENQDTIEIIKFKYGEPSLSAAARIPMNKPFSSSELYLMWLAGKQLFEGRKVNAAFYHLKNKDDTTQELIGQFNHKKGKNIVSVDFDEEIYSPSERILESLSEDIVPVKTSCIEHCEKCNYSSICAIDEYDMVQDIDKTEAIICKNTAVPTSAQDEAIKSTYPFERVIACAGAGKTYTLAKRVVNLYEQGVKEDEILLITFTNLAKEEMKEKISSINTSVNVDRIEINTFNGFSMSLIQKYYKLLGYTKRPKLITKVKKIDILLDLLEGTEIRGFNYKEPLADYTNYKGSVLQALEVIEKFSRGLFNDEDYEEEYVVQVRDLYERYIDLLRQHNLIDYGEQIRQATRICHMLKGKRKLKYRHFMIDESQDTNNMQLDLLISLYEACKGISTAMFVGDDDQTIYTFQGAEVANLISLEEMFVNRTSDSLWGLRDIILDKNYRCTTQILNLSHSIVSKNSFRIPKQLISGTNKQGLLPSLTECKDSDDTYTQIAEDISKRNKNQGKTAIIARTNLELEKMAKVLEEHAIKYKHIKNHTYLNNRFVRLIMTYANAIHEPDNELFFAELSYFYCNNIDNKNMYQDYVEFKNIKTAKEFIELSIKFATDCVSKSFVEYLLEQDFQTIAQMVDHFNKMVLYNEDSKVDVPVESTNSVILVTAHQSKGKEYENVYLLLDKFSAEELEIEEERRLLFVACTRAKENLDMFYVPKKRKSKKVNLVDELDVQYISVNVKSCAI